MAWCHLQAVVRVHHTRDAVEAKPIKLELLHPVPQARALCHDRALRSNERPGPGTKQSSASIQQNFRYQTELFRYPTELFQFKQSTSVTRQSAFVIEQSVSVVDLAAPPEVAEQEAHHLVVAVVEAAAVPHPVVPLRPAGKAEYHAPRPHQYMDSNGQFMAGIWSVHGQYMVSESWCTT